MAETWPAPWALLALHGRDKCTATITDTIVGEAWLFTSKTGEVMRKRGLSVSNVRDRFSRIAGSFATNPSKFLAVVRYSDRLEFRGSLHEFPTDALALQCYVPGTTYRNTYLRTEDIDKVVTSTRILPTKPCDDETVPVVETCACSLSRASRLNKTLDLATLSLVRFIERTRRKHVVSLEAEYVVDERDQLWLTWLGTARVREPTTQPEPTTKKGSEVMTHSFDDAYEENIVNDQVNQAATRVESGGDIQQRKKPTSSKWKPTREDSAWELHNTQSQQHRRFPSGNTCAGDYCDFTISDPKQLFNDAEIESLADVTGLVRAASSKAAAKNTDDLVEMAYKSVQLARAEKRYVRSIAISQDEKPVWSEFPETPRLTTSPDQKPTEIPVEEPRAVERQPLERNVAQRYRPVKVCKSCFVIYTLLDEARGILQPGATDQPSTAERRRRKPETPAASSPQQRGRRHGEEKKKRPPQRKKVIPPNPPLWKGRIPESRLYGNAEDEEAARRAEKHFEQLDEYLRGKSDAAARRTEAKAAAVARSRSAQTGIAESSGADAAALYFGRVLVIDARDSTDLTTTIESLENAGFVVDVETDTRTAHEVLVSEFNPSRAGWQLDAVFVADVLDLGDPYDVVREVRSLEKDHIQKVTKKVQEDALANASRRTTAAALDVATKYTRLPVVICTQRTDPDDLRSYKQAGFDGCVSRPVNRLALLSTARAAVPRHGQAIPQQRPIQEVRRKDDDTVVTVTFETTMDGPSSYDDDILEVHENKSRFVNEVAHQLGVNQTRVSLVSVSTKKRPLTVAVKITEFPTTDAGIGFVKALKARCQLVDETTWGRNVIHDATITDSKGNVVITENAERKRIVAGALKNEHTSSAMAAKALALVPDNKQQQGVYHGSLQIDADTSLPYCVLDFSRDGRNTKSTTFNLIVCHDLFDTYERMKIALTPIAAKYPGVQVLLWNYPGQAMTEWREEQLLNNAYLGSCFHALLQHVGGNGHRHFDDDRPYFLLGTGFGASVGAFVVAHYGGKLLANCRGLLLFNGFAFVDPHLAGALHDATNVFSCAPATRPDIPVYFWTRFLFSREYLTKVSTPLALNLYTAVHNPITLKGRMKLTVGALSSQDVRPALKHLNLPIIAVHSTEGNLVKPLHARPWAQVGGGQKNKSDLAQLSATTIHQALRNRKTCIIWVKSGHEVFQEIRKQVSTLVEQVVIGYHEVHDVAFVPAQYADPSSPSKGNHQGHGNFEDNFIDNVLGKVRATKGSTVVTGEDCSPLSTGASWVDFQQTSQQQNRESETIMSPISSSKRQRRQRRRTNSEHHHYETVLDPSQPAFERQDNVVYHPGSGSRIYPSPETYPEVKEYMGWRLKRNRKRLQRLDFAARMIQTAFRNHLSWLVFQRLRRERAILFVQRAWRGHRGRKEFMKQMRRVWASMVIQRAYRGYASRGFFLLLRTMHAAAGQIQRIVRGGLARFLVKRLQDRRKRAAMMIQSLVRRWFARISVFRLRGQAIACRAVQRVYRGHLGRRRAENERMKYLFSKSQSQGIEFGRQMLLEHKLHATRLQSEVSLLTQEKVETEESVEALLEEISEFEQGVNQLEKEMHQLSKIESEAVGVLDEEAKFELREQKMRLDQEFGSMLATIAERRDKLSGLEGKLATLDHARQAKEEQLRTLERKLVVLLDEQQRELDKIKRRQDARGDLLTNARDLAAAGKLGESLVTQSSSSGGPNDVAKFTGPTVKEKKQAAQLMQSTETLMKFGFMSMSMTYFSSLNMIKAMRTVATQDTVMAALHAKTSGDPGAAPGGMMPPMMMNAMPGNNQLTRYEEKVGGEPYQPTLKPGQMPGDEPLKVSAWSVEDVARWLQTLSLGQYREAFIDAAVDGAFLYDLDDDDLRNTLGIEHRLHRKKILNMTNKLKAAEFERNRQLRIMANAPEGSSLPLDEYMGGPPPSSGKVSTPAGEPQAQQPVNIEEIFSLVRHAKVKKLKEALENVPNRRFDPSLVKVPFVPDFGTAYVDEYEREHFNLNKVDQHGNSLLIVAAQNGSLNVAKVLIAKGANPNHQNTKGQTPGHYASTYQFYDFLGWLFDPSGGAGDDTLTSAAGLGVYDGLDSADDDDDDPLAGANNLIEDG